MPALTMFILTAGFAGVFMIPVTSYSPKDNIVGFYWRGVWLFLAMICAVAGGVETVNFLGLSAEPTGQVLLTMLLLTFVLFVVFGWFRLAGKAFLYGAKRLLKRS